MKLLTKQIEKKLQANSLATDLDHKPVVKLFNPCGAATWLITEIDEDGIMFGLCDLGFGSPELGYVALSELHDVQLPFGLKIERDLHFKATQTITEYADEARIHGEIAA
mgnify:CR=1 FL=1